jgi:hypothetical protein
MYIGIRRIRMTGRSKKMELKIDRGSKHVILEMVFHSTPVKTATLIFIASWTNQHSVKTTIKLTAGLTVRAKG